MIAHACDINHKRHIHRLVRLFFGVVFVVLCSLAETHASQSLGLAWDRSADPSVSGYRLYCGTHSGVYTQTIEIGNATTTLISNLVSGTRYFFAVTAYNAAGIESPPSNEVSYAAPASPGATPTPTPAPLSSPSPSPSQTPRPTPWRASASRRRGGRSMFWTGAAMHPARQTGPGRIRQWNAPEAAGRLYLSLNGVATDLDTR